MSALMQDLDATLKDLETDSAITLERLVRDAIAFGKSVKTTPRGICGQERLAGRVF